ncbi:hypothetical protein [Niallia sp. Krafla_26]
MRKNTKEKEKELNRTGVDSLPLFVKVVGALISVGCLIILFIMSQ